VLKKCLTCTIACHHSDTVDTDTWPIRDVSGDLASSISCQYGERRTLNGIPHA
jgi:hypothetical protein